MTDWHWQWCRQGVVTRNIMDPVAKQALEEMTLPPCPCRMVTDEMRFVRLTWLLDDDRDLRNLPRMQDLPQEAFIPLEDMRYAYFISHRWTSPQHPDTSGRQIALALSSIWYTDHTGMWYDYLCLPQAPRSEMEESAFIRLLPQVGWLTVTTVPILVVESDQEYASRAWCVAEAMGAYRSGWEFHSVSLAVQAMKYHKVLVGGAPVWDSGVDIEDGYRPGIAKLQDWLRMGGLSVHTSRAEQQTDVKKHLDCMRAVAAVFYSFLPIVRETADVTDSDLLAVAARHDLQCTYQDDLLRCMRLILDVLRLACPVGDGME